MLLRFKPNLMDPLPLYIVLLAGLPLVLPLMLRNTWAVVAVSTTIYLLAPWMGWNLRAIADGVWYFNPVTWQLLFILGGAAALLSRQERPGQTRPLRRQPIFVAATIYVLMAGVLTLSWRWPQIHDALMPSVISDLIYPISKTDLSPLRLLHFLVLAYVTAKLLPGRGWTENWLAQHTCRMGRYSLEVFCLGVVLAPLADMINAMAGDALAMQLLTAVAGAALMGLLAMWLEFNKRLDQSLKASVQAG